MIRRVISRWATDAAGNRFRVVEVKRILPRGQRWNKIRDAEVDRRLRGVFDAVVDEGVPRWARKLLDEASGR